MTPYDDLDKQRDATDPGEADRLGVLDEIESLRDLGYDDGEIADELGEDFELDDTSTPTWTEGEGSCDGEGW